MRPTLLYRAYSAATFLALPFLEKKTLRRVTDHGMSDARAREKLGYATEPRPDGTLIWFHAASVGEMMSVLALITRLGESLPKAAFLLTSGTATSANIVATRLPPRTRHQFAPLDAPAPVSRFLKHWRPDAAILVESELWPQMLMRTHGANIPLALVNARLSDGSVRQWARASKTAKMLFGTFRLILSQSPEMTRSLSDLGAPKDRVRTSANLKSMALKLPVDAALATSTKDALATRPVWIAASTHPGEEEIVLEAHKSLLDAHPDVCLILVPRHPERGDAVAALIKQQGWPAPRRSQGETPNGPVYLADTVGELGTWYALGGSVFLGGSLKPIGGHNPFEPALSGVAVCSGPHVTNFKDTFDDMTKTGAALIVSDGETLAKQIDHWLSSPDTLSAAQTAAQAFCDGQTGQVDDIAADLIHALELSDA